MDAADPSLLARSSSCAASFASVAPSSTKDGGVLEQSIAVIDSAIAQSRAALIQGSGSGFLATQLNHSLGKESRAAADSGAAAFAHLGD